MASFVIDGTEFGIDPSRSRCVLNRRFFRRPALTVEVEGDPGLFEKLKQTDGSAWAWALYPPTFSLRALPVAKPIAGRAAEVRLAPEEVERHEVGLYMLEHNAVTDVVLRLGPGGAVVIWGNVSLCGQPGEFRIEWSR
jgi:hypothetical protein